MLRRHFLAGSVALALKKDQTDAAVSLVEKATARGYFSAAALHVKQGSSELSRAFGKATPETPFLLASITKPMTATAVMILSDRKALTLADPVKKYIPEFTGGDRDMITIRHLLTHTSGLPDMLPENEALRKRHAPLADFVAGTCKVKLLFKPGTQVKYQSMGLLLAGEIVERVTKTPLRDFLRKEVYSPLKMTKTSLGLGGRAIPATAQCQVPDEDWQWNSQYWRDLGSPWGGAHATAADIGRFLRAFLKPTAPILKPETAAAMIVNQTEGLNDSRGLGWQTKPSAFGSGCSAKTFGHGGSTGTMSWADPEKDLTFVLLTTLPQADEKEKLVKQVCDSVSSA
jgi:CubicO group peptidase (beta-lactamase class C family)